MKFVLFFLLLVPAIHIFGQPNNASVSLGIIADCQYADQPTRGLRHYKNSITKLEECVSTFNDQELHHVFHLGDFIDDGAANFLPVQRIIDKLVAPFTHVLGNHDYSVADSLKPGVHKKMGMPSRYFAQDVMGWRFLILDGNDVSLHANPKSSKLYRRAKRHHERHYPELPTWNGALGKSQMKWLKAELKQAEEQEIPVILLCHFPVYPSDVHNLWNDEEVVALIERYSIVKAWLNGHNHAGNYGVKSGIHFVTFKGMVDTNENAFAHVSIGQEVIKIRGFGREENRELRIRK
ncbi:MAG: hypothetical protein HKN87_10035 [Saprospiraceae bacterium]|nr:hypothetical protein [Saprospiraceae bacterium]